MTTKAEWFRYNQERSKPKPVVVAAAQPPPMPSHAERKAAFVRETVMPGARPSRKSTRKSANRQRTDGQFQAKRHLAEASPEVRANRWTT